MIRPRARGEYIGSVSAVDQASALKDPIKEFQLDGSEAIGCWFAPAKKVRSQASAGPAYSSHDWKRRCGAPPSPAFDFTLYGIRTRPTFSRAACPKVANKRLGHSKVAIKLDLSSHVLPNMQSVAAALLDAQLEAALRNERRKGTKMIVAS